LQGSNNRRSKYLTAVFGNKDQVYVHMEYTVSTMSQVC
jgi:hypothetical protein